jgi:hypothetical protein
VQAEKVGPDLLRSLLFYFIFFYLFFPQSKGFFPQKRGKQQQWGGVITLAFA